MKPLLALALIGIGVGLSGGVGRAQQTPEPSSAAAKRPSDPLQTFRADTRIVPVNTSVTDEAGHFVRHLTKDDFEVRDNGHVQPITFFETDSEPIDAIVLLDGSRSMVNGLDEVLTAADHFVVRLRPGDQARVGSFSDQIRLTRNFTADRDELSRRVNDLFDLRVGMVTRLWDAVQQAIESFPESTDDDRRRVVIVFTDGDDTASSATFDSVLGQAHKAGVRLYLVLVDGVDRIPEERLAEEEPPHFEDLADRTGGGYYSVGARGDLNGVFTRMNDELHSSYVLGFRPQALDGRRHTLNVRVKRTGILVSARRHYLATAEGVAGG